MKHLLTTTIAAVVLVGCGQSVGIHQAAKDGNIKAVKQHIATGTDVDVKDDNWGGTPLYFAACKGHKEIAEMLIENGADINAKTKYGLTPMHGATTKEVAELLIAKGAGVNAKTGIGRTPMHTAAMTGHKEIVELLIAKGADVNSKDKSGYTPLHGAATDVTVELLIAEGADVNAKGDDGSTPLDRVISHYYERLAEILRKHGGKTAEELKAAGN